jgi:hypothetical protein
VSEQKNNVVIGAFDTISLNSLGSVARALDNSLARFTRETPDYLSWIPGSARHCPGQLSVSTSSGNTVDASIILPSADERAFCTVSRLLLHRPATFKV